MTQRDVQTPTNLSERLANNKKPMCKPPSKPLGKANSGHLLPCTILWKEISLMRSAYPDRRFLLLMDSSEETELIKDILKSPLDQASKLITSLFEERLGEVKDGLDVIKQFAAGIGRAEKLAEGYTLAAYYPFLFAFHQNFHSSFRARQGKVLERMVQRILQKYGRGAHVPDSNKERLTLLGEVFGSVELPKLDIDVLAVDVTNKKTLIIQLRSRDDTGGTTAKASHVDFLRELLRLNTVPQGTVLYLVCVWDPRDAQQKRYSSLVPRNVEIDNVDFGLRR